jgi:hypothetical protein
MELIELESGSAMLADSAGYYLAAYAIDEVNKKVTIDEVVFSIDLEALEDLDSYSVGVVDYSESDVRNIYAPQYSPGHASAIKDVIEDYLFPSKYLEGDEDHEAIKAIMAICQSKNGRKFSCKLFASDKSIETMAEERIHVLFRARPDLLLHFLSPLNALLRLYGASTRKPSLGIARRICQRIFEDAIAAGFIDHELSFTIDLDRSRIRSIEPYIARLWVTANILNKRLQIAEGLLKASISVDESSFWHKVSERTTRRFDVEAFRKDYPELYEKYTSTNKTIYLTKKSSGKYFPISETDLLTAIKNGFDI